MLVLWCDKQTDARTPSEHDVEYDRWHHALQQISADNIGELVETRSGDPVQWVPSLVEHRYEREAVPLSDLHRLCGDGAHTAAL